MMFEPYYPIMEFTLPNERVKFEVHISMNNRTAHASIASLILNPSLPQKVVELSKDSLSIGRETGEFELTANVLKPFRNKMMSFQWSCHYVDSFQPCVLYSNNTKLLVTKEMQNKPQLTLQSFMLQMTKHRFDLNIFYNETKKAFYKTFTTVNVNEGKVPLIYMSSISIIANNKLITKSLSSDAILVPSHTQLVIKGIVNNLESDHSIEWLFSESLFNLQWNNRYINRQIHTELHLHKGLLTINNII